MEAKLRLSVWVGSPFVSKYVRDFVTWSQSDKRLDLVGVMIADSALCVGSDNTKRDTSPNKPAMKRAFSWLSIFFFECLTALERLLLLKNCTHRQHLRTVDVHSLVERKIIHQWPGPTTMEEPAQSDLLVAFTPTLPDKALRDTARMGTLAVLPSDRRVHRNGPPGFWEVYFREDVTGFTIQHVMPGQDNPATLMRGAVATQFYYLLNQASLYQKMHYYLVTLVEQLITTGTLPRGEEDSPYSFRPLGVPTPHQTLFYLAGLIALSFSKLLQKCGADYRWKVGFIHSDWRNAVLWQASLIENPSGRYLADPFVITRDDRHFCFVEDYDIAKRRGRISVYELSGQTAAYLGVALEEGFHLSYPYLFHYSGQLYMCPETSEAKEIRIYRCVEFPLRWTLEKTIMKNVSAVDTMLFEMNGKWRMLTNIDPERWGDHSLELRVFSAKSPLDEEWVPHPGNPFFIDASRARNGGMARDGDRLFRIAQGQGFGMYGKRTTINEIIELDDSSYAEQPLCVIAPKFRRTIYGTHHLHSDGKVTVFDFA